MNLEYFGKNLQKLRASKSMTQEELAHSAHIAVSQIGRIERGEVNPGLYSLFSIAKGLNVSPHQLFDFDEDSKKIQQDEVNHLIDVVTNLASPNCTIDKLNMEKNSKLSPVLNLLNSFRIELRNKVQMTEVLYEILSTCKMGYMVMDVENSVIYWCKNMRKLFGIDEDITFDLELLNSTIHPNDLGLFHSNLDNVHQNGKSIKYTYTGIKSNGEEISVLLYAKVLDNQEFPINPKQIIGIVRIAEDQTFFE